MINKILRKDNPKQFEAFVDDFEETSYEEHRRGSTFFTKRIVRIDEEWFPEIDKELYGFWETNKFVYSEDDWDKSEITELNRVEKKEKVITTTEWVKITE